MNSLIWDIVIKAERFNHNRMVVGLSSTSSKCDGMPVYKFHFYEEIQYKNKALNATQGS